MTRLWRAKATQCLATQLLLEVLQEVRLLPDVLFKQADHFRAWALGGDLEGITTLLGLPTYTSCACLRCMFATRVRATLGVLCLCEAEEEVERRRKKKGMRQWNKR